MASVASGNGERVRRPKISLACEPCRVRKSRCNGVKPLCSTCERRGLPLERCVYKIEQNARTASNNEQVDVSRDRYAASSPPSNMLLGTLPFFMSESAIWKVLSKPKHPAERLNDRIILPPRTGLTAAPLKIPLHFIRVPSPRMAPRITYVRLLRSTP